MNQFNFYNPTKIIFGRDRFNELDHLVPKDAKVLVLYGGGSVKKFGTLDRVLAALPNREILEFGGIEANPRYETLMKAVDVVRAEKIDFLLAVGGGSVIDGTKFIALASYYEGDGLDLLRDRSITANLKQALPLAAQTSAQTIIQLLERTQYIKGSWLNELGVQSNYNMKRETITANENILNVDNLLPFTDNMLYSRNEAMKELERVFGLKWTYKFSSSWQKLRTEIKLTEQRDFKKGEQSNQLDNKENDNSEDSGNGKNE